MVTNSETKLLLQQRLRREPCSWANGNGDFIIHSPLPVRRIRTRSLPMGLRMLSDRRDQLLLNAFNGDSPLETMLIDGATNGLDIAHG